MLLIFPLYSDFYLFETGTIIPLLGWLNFGEIWRSDVKNQRFDWFYTILKSLDFLRSFRARKWHMPPQKSEPKSTQLSEKITSRTVRRRRVVYMEMRAYCVLKNKSAVSLILSLTTLLVPIRIRPASKPQSSQVFRRLTTALYSLLSPILSPRSWLQKKSFSGHVPYM